MSTHNEIPTPWWGRYNIARLIGFLLLLACVGGAVSGILDAFLQHRHAEIYSFPVRFAVRGFGFAIPVFGLYFVRKLRKDQWLVRRDDDVVSPDDRSKNN